MRRLLATAAIVIGILGVAAPAIAVPEVNHPGPNLNVVVGTTGNDFLVGSLRHDLIFGLRGNDRIFGLRGHDILRGGLGNDRLFGGRGRDIIRGGLGTDICTGDVRDTFSSCETVIIVASF